LFFSRSQVLLGNAYIYEPQQAHFITCTVLHWIPIFTRTQTTQIIFDSIKYLQEKYNLIVYAYVILENHLHMVVKSDDIAKSINSFKTHTAKEILKLLQEQNVKTILEQLAFYKKAHKTKTTYQF